MQVLIKDTINNTEYTAPSITIASAYTYKKEGRSVTPKTLRLDSGKIVKGWIFSIAKLVICIRRSPPNKKNKIFDFY